MSNEVLKNLGTELILETAGSSTSLSDGDIRECDSDNRQPGDDTGYHWGFFEFSTAAGGFSAAPTEGAVVNLYEQKINSDGNDAPDIVSDYKHDWVGTFQVDPTDAQQHLSLEAPIHRYGGKYWVEWLDGGAGTASVDAGWELRLIPFAFGNA